VGASANPTSNSEADGGWGPFLRRGSPLDCPSSSTQAVRISTARTEGPEAGAGIGAGAATGAGAWPPTESKAATASCDSCTSPSCLQNANRPLRRLTTHSSRTSPRQGPALIVACLIHICTGFMQECAQESDGNSPGRAAAVVRPCGHLNSRWQGWYRGRGLGWPVRGPQVLPKGLPSEKWYGCVAVRRHANTGHVGVAQRRQVPRKGTGFNPGYHQRRQSRRRESWPSRTHCTVDGRADGTKYETDGRLGCPPGTVIKVRWLPSPWGTQRGTPL
jgi:hypothetical protein